MPFAGVPGEFPQGKRVVMQLGWKMGPPTLAVSLACLALLAFLNLHKFEGLLDEVWTSRIHVTAIDSRLALENSLGLGLALADSSNNQTVIDGARAADKDIVAVQVVDLLAARGAVLFSSGKAMAQAPEEWLRLQEGAGRSSWRLRVDDRHQFLGWPLVDPLDRVVGMLVLETFASRQADMVAEAGRRVWLALAFCGLLLAVAIGFVTRWLLAPLETSLDRAAAILDGDASAPGEGELEQLAWRFRRVVEEKGAAVTARGEGAVRR